MSLKLNSYIKNINVISNNINEKLIFNIIIGSFGLLAFFYIFLLGNMVKNIIERQGLEAKARTLTSEVRNLEVTYLSMSSDVDLDFSYSLGFKNTQAIFATRKALGLNFGESFGSPKTVQNDI